MYQIMLSIVSSIILLTILTTADNRNKDRTWKSFSVVVSLYAASDMIYFFMYLVKSSFVFSICYFSSVCAMVLALFEFHFYLLCFTREKKKVKIPDSTLYVGGCGIIFLLGWTVISVLQGHLDSTFVFRSKRILHLFRFIMVLPDCYFLIRQYKNIGVRNTVSLSSHLLVPTLCSIIDLWEKTELTIPVTTLSVLMIYISINLQTEADTMEHKIELEKKERQLQEVRRHVMISQIQPHFIYNVLNIICILCRRDPRTAAKTTRTFARYLRMNVESLKKDHPVPFEEELAHAKTYLELEKVRFRDELEISYDIGPTNFCMPALSLQPMVENAVKHGLCMKEDGDGHLVISTREDGTNWYVIVSDDGVGYDAKKPKKNDGRSHIGVENTKMRIEMMCHGTMETFSIPDKGTNVVITIPKLYDSNCLPSDRVWEKEDEE